MKLSDLNAGQKVIIQIVWDGQTMEFYSEVTGVSDKGAYLTPYLHQGTPLELTVNNNSKATCNLFTDSPENNKRISWRSIELSTIDKKGSKLYHVTTNAFNSMANLDDRRNHDRVVIHKDGKIHIPETGQQTAVKIHDISNVGLSFFAPLSFQPASNQIVVLLNDTINDNTFNLKVACTVARSYNRNGMTFYGCRITEENKEYILYSCLLNLMNKNPGNS